MLLKHPRTFDRLKRAITLLPSPELDDGERRMLTAVGWGDWLTDVSSDSLIEQVHRLAGMAEASPASEALIVTLAKSILAKVSGPLDDALISVMLDALEATARVDLAFLITTNWRFTAMELVKRGCRVAVLGVVFRRLASKGHEVPSRMMEEFLVELLPICTPEQVWQSLDPHLQSSQLQVRLAYAPVELNLLAHLPVEQVLSAARRTPSVAGALGRLSRPYGEQLDAVSSRLIADLGRDGAAANAIAIQAASTPTAVWSIAAFLTEQAQRARKWAKSDQLELKAWANSFAEELERQASKSRDGEEFDRKFG